MRRSFPDCLELGVPGGGSLTWEESKSVLALFAVTSSPLILGNDARKGRMQQRLVDLLTNPDMIAVSAFPPRRARASVRLVEGGPRATGAAGDPALLKQTNVQDLPNACARTS